jgi:hypothetical protein
VTLLVRDVAAAIGEVLHSEGEIVIVEGDDHSYCLVFTKGE